MNQAYDIVVAGAGLGGMTAANRLARQGYRVLLAEQHDRLGGLATFFHRGPHIFDVALHGFPASTRRSFRKYWGVDFAERIIQLKEIRFHNPAFQLQTTFDRDDFTRILTQRFDVHPQAVAGFFDFMRNTQQYTAPDMSTAQLFERFFPDKPNVWRFLLEPITYANGSTFDDPALSYSIVFLNFMNKGVFTFQGGTDRLLEMMGRTLRNNGVDWRTNAPVDSVLVDHGRVRGAVVDGRTVDACAVISNGNLIRTVRDLAGRDHFSPDFLDRFDAAVQLSNSSTQVYIGIKPGERLPEIGDVIFSSTSAEFDADSMSRRTPTNCSYSVYYPFIRPDSGRDRYAVVASANAMAADWPPRGTPQYRRAKQKLIDATIADLDRHIPGIASRSDHIEAATPRTFERYTGHSGGASFGTKYGGHVFSDGLHRQVRGLFHTGSAGIVMSGWLGSINHGILTAHEVDRYMDTEGLT